MGQSKIGFFHNDSDESELGGPRGHVGFEKAWFFDGLFVNVFLWL